MNTPDESTSDVVKHAREGLEDSDTPASALGTYARLMVLGALLCLIPRQWVSAVMMAVLAVVLYALSRRAGARRA